MDPKIMDSKIMDPKIMDLKIMDPKITDPKIMDPKIMDPKIMVEAKEEWSKKSRRLSLSYAFFALCQMRRKPA